MLGGAGFIGFSLARKLSRLSWVTSITCIDDLTPYYPIKLKYDRIDLLLRYKYMNVHNFLDILFWFNILKFTTFILILCNQYNIIS